MLLRDEHTMEEAMSISSASGATSPALSSIMFYDPVPRQLEPGNRRINDRLQSCELSTVSLVQDEIERVSKEKSKVLQGWSWHHSILSFFTLDSERNATFDRSNHLLWPVKSFVTFIFRQSWRIRSRTLLRMVGEYKPQCYPLPKQALILTCLQNKCFETLWEKEKLLITSNFSFSHRFFYTFEKLPTIFIKSKIAICKLFLFGRV